MIAKNVGIRRAKGQFILASNVDLLFSDALFARMAACDLDPNSFYRANRVDIPDGIDENMSFEAQMAYSKEHVIRVNGWDSRFQYVDVRAHGIKELGPISRWITDQIGKRHRRKQPKSEAEYYLLDRNACGDFTMMHRDAWENIEGYAELDLYSIHVDTLGIVAAKALGMQQVVFPADACTYHIDHPTGWSSMGPIEKLKFLEERPGIDFGVLQEVTYFLLEKHQKLGINPPNWGFADEKLEEITF
jgi:GT2 family glycosyltransferase